MTSTVFINNESGDGRLKFKAGRWCALVFAFMLTVLVGACGVSGHDESADEWSKWRREKIEKAKAVELFPEATEVRLFVNGASVDWDEQGVFREGTFPDRGFLLTADEVRLLRDAVKETPPPPAEVACCIPRHAFVFLGRDGKRLGALTVCFECGCADIAEGERLQRHRALQWLDWDEKVIGDIVRAHGVPLYENGQVQ